MTYAKVPIAPSRPLLRYFGGKWTLAPWILSFLPPHRQYVEPFAGAASVLLRKDPSEVEVINDRCLELVNFWKVVRDQTHLLAAAIADTPYSRAELVMSYEPHEDPLEQARRTYVRSWQSIAGAGGTHRSGFRVVPGTNRGTLPHREWRNPSGLQVVAARLRHVVLENDDALSVIRRWDRPHTLFYVDPPYLRRHRSSARYKVEFDSVQEHQQLLNTLVEAEGLVVLSGLSSDLYREHLNQRGWNRFDVSHNTTGGTKVVESIWLNPNAYENLSTVQFDLPLEVSR